MGILNSWVRYKRKLQIAAVVSIILFVLDITVHRPKQVNVLLDECLRLRKKSFKVRIPKIVKLEDYLKVITAKEMFLKKEVKSKNLNNSTATQLSEYDFNGIVQLEKPYVAILKKKNKQQFLVPEGGTFEGIKIKKISQEGIIIEYYDQEKKISF